MTTSRLVVLCGQFGHVFGKVEACSTVVGPALVRRCLCCGTGEHVGWPS